jgi:hypothetical protein
MPQAGSANKRRAQSEQAPTTHGDTGSGPLASGQGKMRSPLHPTRGSGWCPPANTATSGGQRAQGPEATASRREGPTEPVAKGTRDAATATAGADVKGETTETLATGGHP